MILALFLLVLVFAVAGGLVVHPLLFIVAVVALAFAAWRGRVP